MARVFTWLLRLFLGMCALLALVMFGLYYFASRSLPDYDATLTAPGVATPLEIDDILAGEYESVFKGRGMEFDEVREYQPGDEVRDLAGAVIALHTAYLASWLFDLASPAGQMTIALAAYATYVINAAQFLLKLQAARRDERDAGADEPPAFWQGATEWLISLRYCAPAGAEASATTAARSQFFIGHLPFSGRLPSPNRRASPDPARPVWTPLAALLRCAKPRKRSPAP